MNISSAFLQLFKRKTKLDKILGIHYNGEDNLYPDYTESIITNSVTALEASDLMTSFLVGQGFENEANNDISVHDENNTSLLDLADEAAESIVRQRGVFIHANYNRKFQVENYEVLNYSDCRVGKQDSNKYSGKILVCSDWSDAKARKNADVIDVFNPKESVVKEQIKKSRVLR